MDAHIWQLEVVSGRKSPGGEEKRAPLRGALFTVS